MNPYLLTGIVMCLIVLVSLAGTAYLAVMFNRRAKADLEAAMTPLAAAIDGLLDLEEAEVKGRHAGYIVAGRMANGPFGQGREFQTDVIDPAGGTAWQIVLSPAKVPSEPPSREFESADPAMEERLRTAEGGWEDAVARMASRSWMTYDPAAGQVRMAWPMRTRRDLPTVEAFMRDVELVISVAEANRRAQGAPLPERPRALAQDQASPGEGTA